MKMKNKAIEEHNANQDFDISTKDQAWFSSTTFEKSNDKISHVEGEILKDGLLCTSGEATGHGIWLDDQFILDLCTQASKLKMGIKARFGHPNMCASAIGTTLGRWKDFYVCDVIRDDGMKASALRGNLYFSAAAHKAPAGDLVEYVKSLSENDGDLFGASIVAFMSRFFKKMPDGRNVYCNDEGEIVFEDDTELTNEEKKEVLSELYGELEKFTDCDIVDSPAANDGMFSQFSGETVAGQITQFLNDHPTVIKELSENPLIMETIKKHPDEIDGFIMRYNNTKRGNEEMTEKLDKTVEKPQVELSRKEFSEIEGKFGTEIAASVFKTGGNSADALEMAFAAKVKEVETLSTKVGELETELSTANKSIVEFETKIKHFEKIANGKISDFSSEHESKPKAKLGAKR